MAAFDVVQRYLEIFYEGKDLERLYEVLADDLHFSGPWYRFDSARDYVASLVDDPPVGCRYEIIQVFEKGTHINVIYELSKPGGLRAPVSQLFDIRDHKIARILLIFDTASFTRESHD